MDLFARVTAADALSTPLDKLVSRVVAHQEAGAGS
jgi:hypothetical protein